MSTWTIETPLEPVPRAAEHPAWERAFENLPREYGFEPARVEGKLPADLVGTCYRNGPGRLDVAGERYPHWFDGDGAVAAVRYENGSAQGSVRMVETTGLARERKAGRRLFGGYNTPMVRPLQEVFLGDRKNPANTGILAWEGRIYALCEVGKPYEIRSTDLTTIGESDLNGLVDSTFNPHPHRVPARAATYSIGLRRARIPTLSVYEVPDHGAARRLCALPVPGLLMAHDFAVTERHLIVSIPPFRLKMVPLLLRRIGFVDALAWEPERGMDLLIIPLDAPKSAFRVATDACYIEHFANAYERNGELIVDGVTYPDMATLDRFVLALGRGETRGSFGDALVRFVVNLSHRHVQTEVLFREPMELPQVSPRVASALHRFTYVVGYESERSTGTGLWNSVLKIDVHTGRAERYTPGAQCYTSEALFVPRANASDEDDGYILVNVFDARAGQTYEAVLDAQHVSDGPIARVYFPDRVPVRIHGAWVPS